MRTASAFDVETLRSEFPALRLEIDGRPAVFLDGPGGTQVPQRVIDAVSNYYRTANANEGGPFATSVRSDRRLPTCTGPQHLPRSSSATT